MTATIEYVIVVDEEDKEIRFAEKLLAHQKGWLHRAFSAFIFRSHPETKKIELLLQQRAAHKYHSPLLWTNTCCSHPRPGEDITAAGQRRLKEELGLSLTLNQIGYFHYHAHFSNGLSENEIDHILVGFVKPNVSIQANPSEIHDYKWAELDAIQQSLASEPEQFTQWFAQAFNLAVQHVC